MEAAKSELENAAVAMMDDLVKFKPVEHEIYKILRKSFDEASQAYETALRQAEERGKVQEKGVRISEAMEELKRTLSQLFSDSNTTATANRLYASVYEAFKALQELENNQ